MPEIFSHWRRLLMGPIWVAGSVGRPVGMRSAACERRATNSPMDGALDQQARAGHAALSGPAENGRLRAEQGAGDVGIGEHDIGGLAAQFQHARHDVARGFRRDARAGFRRPHEDDETRLAVGDGRRARGGAVARQHADEARWHALGTGAQHAQRQRGERGQFGGLQHHRIARADGGAICQPAVKMGAFHGVICTTVPMGSCRV